jgi:CSLREA domain-containing protein
LKSALTDNSELLTLAVVRRWSIRLGAAGLFVLLALFLLSTTLHSFTRARASGDGAINPKERVELARLSNHVTLRAAGRGNPTINLSDGHDVVAAYEGPQELQQALQENLAEPLSLASADFNEDGVPDLVSGYAYQGRGVVSLLRGNVDAIYANAPEAQQRRANGSFTDAPFLSPARLSLVPTAADFIGAGDFDGDGHWDVVTGSRGSDALYLLAGDGRGGFSAPQAIELAGTLTALVTGEINRADGLTDVVVGVNTKDGPRLLVFEGPNGALKAKPEVLRMPAAVTALALGQLDNSYEMDLAVGAGEQLLIVDGRDRKLSLDAEQQERVRPARLETHAVNSQVRSLAIGDFSGHGQTAIALLTDSGQVEILTAPLSQNSKQKGLVGLQAFRHGSPSSQTWPQATALLRVKVSSLPGDDLVVVEEAGQQLQMLNSSVGEVAAIQTQLTTNSTPVALLPMRLNADSLTDLVFLQKGRSAPAITTTVSSQTFVVNSTADTEDGQCTTTVNGCTLREAINAANGNPGADAINFNIPGPAPYTIYVLAQAGGVLPGITDTVTIDGTTQPNFGGTPIIELNGENAGNPHASAALGIYAGSSTIRGLVVSRFFAQGIAIPGGSRGNNTIEGNYIFDDYIGVIIVDGSGNTIGGTVSAAGNVISGNKHSGVDIETFNPSTGTLIQGNLIGTNPAGTAAFGNLVGVYIGNASGNIIGGNSKGARNVISGNSYGITIYTVSNGTAANRVEGNFIGTDAAGNAALNNIVGIYLNRAPNNTIGGTTPLAGNVISGNRLGGLQIQDDESNSGVGSLVQGNFIGTNPSGTVALGNEVGISIFNSSGNLIGGEAMGARNVISGNVGGGIGVYSGPVGTGSGNANNNRIEGNLIGTNASGTGKLGNGSNGIAITITQGSAANTIGGATTGKRNVISGNNGNGIAIGIRLTGPDGTPLPGSGGTGITVQNNYIGTDVSGQNPIGNTFDGVFVDADSAVNTISHNLISSNGRNGVFLPQNSNPAVRILMDNNSVFGNAALGIDLGVAGITSNDALDTDAGANLQQNFPVLTSFTASGVIGSEAFMSEATLGSIDLPKEEGISVSAVNVNGTLNSAPNTTYTIHWYMSGDSQCVTNQALSPPLATGRIPGVTTDGSGNAPFTIPLEFPAGINTGIINCTATDPQGNTSEFSACLPVTSPPRTLTVGSINPVSGVNITVTPGDNNTQANGATQFTRFYYNGSVVALSAPATASGNNFQKWQRDGADFSFSQSINVTMDANHTMTAVYVSPTWQPVVLTEQQIAEMKAWTVGGRTSVYVKPQFPDAGYRVVNWGQVVKSGNDLTVDASVEKFTGVSIQSVVSTAQIYDLGPLANGTYNFNFKTSGTLAKTLQFSVSSTVPPPNPIDSAREFVKQQYRDFLNREADQAGEDFWTDNITKCNDPARRPAGQTVEQCTLRQKETTSGAFFLSPEFQYTSYFVYRMYQGALGRQPKLSEFITDAQFVGHGIIVNGQLSAAKINQNKAAFAQQFVNCTDATKYRCAEFKAIYDGLTNPQFVDKLFQTTGVNATATERIDLVNSIGASQTRGSIVQKVVDGINVIAEGNQQFTTTYGQAFYNAEFTRAFVELEYFGYMKRDPDDAGYAFWLGKLNQFGGNFVNAEMVLAFISSPEYRARFGQP